MVIIIGCANYDKYRVEYVMKKQDTKLMTNGNLNVWWG